MTVREVSIGQVKRDISELVNRVAFGGERIILTSRGRPKAAIVSVEDYARLEGAEMEQVLAEWSAWLDSCGELGESVLRRRGERPLDLDALWDAARADREGRDASAAGS